MADLVSARWPEVGSVGGDTALFVGRWRSLARRVSMYGMPGNRVHFLDDDRGFSRDCPDSFGSYDMSDGKTYPLLPPVELCRSNGDGDTPATWLFPRDQEVITRWCDLPADVLGLVLRHLSSREDRLHLRVVCRDWCASTQNHLRRRPGARPPEVTKPLAPAAAVTTMSPPPPAVAYLALPNGKLFGYPGLTPRRLDKKSPAAGVGVGGYIGAAGDDWLLFHDEGGLFRLTSPFTGETRLLPSFHGIRAHPGLVELVNDPALTIRHQSSAAATRAHWPDDMTMAVRKLVVCPDAGGFVYAAAIFGREHYAKVALCSLETFSWSHSAGDRWRWYDDLAFVGGNLFAVTAAGDLLAFEIGVDVSDAAGGRATPFIARVERVIGGGRYVPSTAMVHSGGELLMMQRRFLSPYAGGDSGASRFEVFLADLASSQWESVWSLGGEDSEALFVGRLCSRAVRAGRRRRIRGDQIFFLPDDCVGMSFWEPRCRRGDHHAAVYDMWDRTVTYLLPRQPGEDEDDDDGHTMATWLFETSATTARRDTSKK
ncbi:unnamed protein product [Urochloa humidicola]